MTVGANHHAADSDDPGLGRSRHGIEDAGLTGVRRQFWNLTTAQLMEHAVRRGEGLVASGGPLVVSTGEHTGRSPRDKFVVREPSSADDLWWGKVNVPFDEDRFDRLHARVLAYFQQRDVYVQDLHVGADSAYRMGVRFINETAWHNLFVRTLFLQPSAEELADFRPGFTVLHAPNMRAVPELDGTRSGAFIVMHFGKRLVLIGGTHYGGEQKKSIFTAMNYYLPKQDVLTMHCSANYSRETGDVALFFGLSGTGKTTLSADPDRILIGDDEHAWSDAGVFNLEGGCYAKVIRLSAEAEPQIHAASHRFGTVLENVVIDPITRQLDLDDASLTENTRSAYPVQYIPGCDTSGQGGHPTNIIFLTADAFGVLPPIARLSRDQALYHFLSGYTAKVAGTEKGVTEPQATFSACFGAPFLPLRPAVYASMLGDRLARHNTQVWLVNTGWTEGPYGVGHRLSIAHTRRLVQAALSGELDDVPCRQSKLFKLQVPLEAPDVPAVILHNRNTWDEPAAYDRQADKLAGMFRDNFRTFASEVDEAVRTAGPHD